MGTSLMKPAGGRQGKCMSLLVGMSLDEAEDTRKKLKNMKKRTYMTYIRLTVQEEWKDEVNSGEGMNDTFFTKASLRRRRQRSCVWRTK